MRARILAELILGVALSAFAQTNQPPANTRSLSLPECIDLALQRNLDLQIEHLSADIARDNLTSSYGPYDPLFSFRARHDFISQPGDFDPQKFNLDYPYDLNTDILGPALTGRLPIGLSYDFSANAGKKDAATDFRSNTNDAILFPGGIRRTNNYFADAGVALRQHLLKDSWIDPYRATILVSRKQLSISQQALRFQIMKTVLAVELGYYDLIAARERINVEEKALELRKQLVAETQRRVQVGDLPPLDSDQAETQLQNTLTALAATREALLARQNAFKNLLTDNFQEWVDVDLQPAGALEAVKVAPNRSESSRRALRDRPDLVEARLAVERSDVTVRFRLNQLFPSLDVIGRYGGLGVDTDANAALNNAFSFHDPAYYYGVVVSFPLSSVAERGNYRASKATREIARLQLKKAEQLVLLQVADWVNRVETRFSQVNSTRQARTFAEAALAAEQKKLQNGLSTTFLVLQMQEALISARTAEVQALVDYNKALAQLAFAEGSTLEKHSLTLEVK